MRTKVIDVKTKGKVVATVEVNQYETLEELQENVGDNEIVAFCNRMLATDVTNTERAKHRPSSTGQKRRRTIAMQVAFDGGYKDQLVELIQGADSDAIEKFLDSDEIQQLVTASLEDPTESPEVATD